MGMGIGGGMAMGGGMGMGMGMGMMGMPTGAIFNGAVSYTHLDVYKRQVLF